MYLIKGEFGLLVVNYLLVPLGYSGSGDVNSLNELRIWLREYFYLNKFLYFSLFSLLTFELFRFVGSMRLNYFKNIVNLNILISLIIYFLGNHSYASPLDVLCLFP